MMVAYLTYSGNTEEVSDMIQDYLQHDGVQVDTHRIGIDAPFDPEEYELVFLGTFTWEQGSTPDEVKDFVLEIGYKPANMVIFGSGDTQFGGDEMFCKAVDKLHTFYESRFPVLKIEQSPRGQQQQLVQEWLKGVVHDAKSYA